MFSVSVGDLTGFPYQCGVHQIPPRHFLVQILQTQQEGAVTKPGQNGLGHPLEVHVAGQDGEVGAGDGRGGGGGVAVGHENIHQELEGGLPPDGLPEHHHGLHPREELVEGAGRGPPSLVVHTVQTGEHVAEGVHRDHLPEAQALGDGLHGALAHHQHLLVVVLGEHLEGGVGHHHLVLGHRNIQPVGELVRLLLAESVAGVGHEDGGDPPLGCLAVVQQLEGVRSAGEDSPAPHYHAVNVEHQTKAGDPVGPSGH